HADYLYKECAFPIVSIGCAKCEDMQAHKPPGFVTPRRVWGTYSQILFDVMVISPGINEIFFIRVGAGESRSLSGKLAKEESAVVKKVITYGSFDLFHEGHYRLLQRAKALGDYLIVGVTSEHFDENRGKLNIVDSLMERIHNVEKTGFADEIIIEDHVGQKVEDIQKYHVDIFTLGSDWTGKFDYLQEYCQVVYLERTKGISSTMKRQANYKLLSFGVIGSGRIAERFVDEAIYVSGVNVEGVYNPHIDSANAFQRRHVLAFATDDLAEFWPKINAVYIASPHGTHYEYAKEALVQGIHVLCEKPLCLKKSEAEELFALAKDKGVVLMEAVKTAYSPGFIRLISMAKSGVIGEVRDVEACFTRITPSNLRELTDLRYGGSFTELGSYTLLPIVKLLGAKYKDIRFESFFAENSLDVYTKVYLKYNNALATAKTGLKIKSDGQLLISGTNGYIRVTPPWWKTTEFEICYEDFTQNEKVFTKYQGVGLRYELSDFVSTINGYRDGGFKLTAEESIAMAEIMEKYLKWRKEQHPRTK
ncbi:Gfo/Idh/MocA family oxidoreductase, partial [Selenomonas sp.]|uniref:Gfo/Idh/MocA family oxidoreductase n=1 Tax=Selenomonas sp. TaxID=2053611 RepID=UPI00345B61D6